MTDGLATYTDPAFDRSLLTPHTNTHKHTKIHTSNTHKCKSIFFGSSITASVVFFATAWRVCSQNHSIDARCLVDRQAAAAPPALLAEQRREACSEAGRG